MKQNKLLSMVILLSMVLAALTAPTLAQEPSKAEPARAPRSVDSQVAAPAAPAPDWGGSWQYGPDTGFAFTRFDGGYYPANGMVYFMGGRLSDGNTDGSVWSFDPVAGTYADMGVDLVTPVSNYKMNLLQDGGGDWAFYVLCGRPAAGGVTAAVQAYYPDTNTVVQLDPADNYPGAVSCTSGLNAVYDNKVYVAGGFDGTVNQAETWVFDPTAAVGSKWTQIPSANLNLARAYIMGAVVDDMIYAIGGNWYDASSTACGQLLCDEPIVEVLDPNDPTPTWNDAAVADMPEACSSSRAYGFGSDSPYVDPGDDTPLAGKIVSGCGQWPDENNHVYVYDTALDYWSAMGEFPGLNVDRRDHAGEFLPDTPGMWVWGGRQDNDANVLVSSEYYALDVAGACNILLVDDDWDFGGVTGGGRPYYTSTLEYLGYGYGLWDVATQGQPSTADLAPYDTVIWFTGYAWHSILTDTVTAEIATYLDDGGNLLLSSQEYHYAWGLTPFMQNYMGVDSIVDDAIVTTTVGIAGTIGDGLGPYTMVRPDDWEAYWPTAEYEGPYDDEVYANAAAVEPFRYDAAGSMEPNATNYESGIYKTVYLGWPLEWIDTVEERAEILGAALDWLCTPTLAEMALIPTTQMGGGVPGASVAYTLTLINNLGFTETFDIDYAGDWSYVGPATVGPVVSGTSEIFWVSVTVPIDANCYDTDVTAITATAQTNPAFSDDAYLNTMADPPGMGDLAGVVYDANTGLGIEDAYVYLELGEEYYEDWAGPDGAYRLPDVPTCVYDGGANAVGYFNYYFTATTPMTMDFDLDAGWPDLSHDAVSVVMLADSMATVTMTLANTGTGDLNFYISELPEDAIYPTDSGMPLGIDPQVYADLAASPDGQAKFIVYLAEQADLSAAEGIEDWAARGQYVLNALQATAERSQAALKADLDAAGARYESRYIVNALVVEGGVNLVDSILARPEVAFIGPNAAVPAPEPVGDVLEAPIPDAVEWNIQRVGADQVWSTFGVTGTGVIVSNIDTGVLYTHTALMNQYRGYDGMSFDHDYNWWDPYGDMTDEPYDWDGHGSHTMGTMLGDDGMGNQIGMAPGAQWIACNGFDHGGSGYTAELLECAEFLLAPWDLTGANPDPAMRPHVINNSWGGGGADWWYNQAIYAWRAAGIIGIFSAGNAGPSCESIGAPDYANIMLVGATDMNDSNAPGSPAQFSSRGPTDIAGLTKPDVSAPGVSIRSAVNTGGYGLSQGTSMAAPHVAGEAALIWSAQPDLIGDVQLTYWVLEQSAMTLLVDQGYFCGDDITDTVPNNQYGWGLIDAFEAVSMALNSNWEIDWLMVDPMYGDVMPGESADIALMFDSTGMSEGMCYTGTLKTEFNDPYVMETMLPVEMCVVACAPVEGVTLTLETAGDIYVGDTVDFSADIIPDGFSAPYTYIIDYGDSVTDTGSSDVDPFSFNHTYAASDTYTVVFTVWNCDMITPVVDTVEVVVTDECISLTSITIEGDTSGAPGQYTFDTTIAPPEATSVVYLWDNGDTTASSTRTFSTPDVYTLVVTATNCGDFQVTDSHTITITEEPTCTQVTGVDLTVQGGIIYTDTLVEFTADISPDGFTAPYTYVVYLDGTTLILPQQSSDDPLTFQHTFENTGTYEVEIQVWNCDMDEADAVVDTVQVTVSAAGVCVDITGVDLTLVTTGDIYPNDQVDFSANITPENATLPFNYTIDYGDGSAGDSGTSSALLFTFSYSYTVAGTYTVEFAAWNCDMAAPIIDTVEVVVIPVEEIYTIYLPIVIKGD